jgi:hypothetical protein
MSNHHLDSATCCFVHGLIGFVGFSSFVIWFPLVFLFRLFSFWLVTAQKFKNPLIYTHGYPWVNQKIKKYIRSANFFLI